MRWYRLYDEIIDDPKILKLPIEIRWRYIEALSIANRQQIRGSLPDMEDIAIHMRTTIEEATKAIDALVFRGLVIRCGSTQALVVHGWESRQFKSDDVTARVERSKSKKKEQPDMENGNVPMSAGDPVLDQIRTDTEQIQNREEKDADAIVVSEASPTPKKSKPKKNDAEFVKPDYLPDEVWDEFKAVRKRKGGKDTPYAYSLVVKELEKLRGEGYDPVDVVNQSIRCNYIDVFPVRNKNSPPTPSGQGNLKSRRDSPSYLQPMMPPAIQFGTKEVRDAWLAKNAN